MPSPVSPTPMSDILYELALDKRPLNADVLDEYVRAHPQHAQELTAFAVELALDALVCQDVDAVATSIDCTRQSAAVSAAVSRFHNRLFETRRQAAPLARVAPPPPGVENPLASLDRLAFLGFVERLQINRVFAMKLRDRQIQAATIPERFMERVAEALGVARQIVEAHLRGPVVVQASAQSYKADQKPVVAQQQTYEQAVRTSNLTAEQQVRLLAD